jgi:hypothetical protein
MKNETTTNEILHIAKDHVAPLIERFGMVRNEIAPLFDYPPASAGAAQAAGSWWQGLKEEQQYTYRSALAAIASPMLILDIGINSHNERLTNTHAVVPSMRWNDPIFLLASEEGKAQFRLEYLKQADLFTNTLLLYLTGGAPVYEMEMKFEITVVDFAVFLAIVDLRQKLRFRALLAHDIVPTTFPVGDIASEVADGFAFPDPRWLLPFSLPVLHLRPEALSSGAIHQSLDNLAKMGLIKKSTETITLTEPGERFAESVAARTSCIAIDVYGIDTAGNHGRQSVLLIRGDNFLWYAGVGGTRADTIVVTCIGLDTAEGLLKELFTPVAAPKPAKSAGAATTVPAQAPAPAAAPHQGSGGAARHFCQSCGTAIQPGKKFCPQCGAKID